MLRRNYNPKIWVKAVVIWADDPYAVVQCPNCEIGFLDLKYEKTQQLNVVNRVVHCNNCGISETFTTADPSVLGFNNFDT